MRSLDRDYLESFYQGITQGLDVIYDMFLDETPAQLYQTRQLISDGDHEKAADIVHSILPSFSTIGIPKLSADLRIIYNDLKAGKSIELLSNIDAFIGEFALYLPAIEAEQKRLKEMQ